MFIKSEDKVIYCYNCRKRTLFTCSDINNNGGVDNHCNECVFVWFEWQNRAVEREKEKWVEYNGGVANNSKVNYPMLNKSLEGFFYL